MMVVTKDEFFLNQHKYISKIADGEVFVYPTDTIYGIGCDATNEASVLKVRNAKHQHERPLSVIAPSVEWIKENCEITEKAKEWCKKLPGPYTLVLKLKNTGAVATSVSDSGSIGVRIPNHLISKFVEKLGFPIITTSANVSGKDFMTSIENLDPEVAARLDFVVDAGEIKGRPSSIIYLDKEEVAIKQR